MNNPIVVKSVVDANYATFSASFADHGDERTTAMAAIVAADEFVFADGRSAEVEVNPYGRHGGAFVDGYTATVRFSG